MCARAYHGTFAWPAHVNGHEKGLMHGIALIRYRVVTKVSSTADLINFLVATMRLRVQQLLDYRDLSGIRKLR